MRAAEIPVRIAHARIAGRRGDRRSTPEPGGLHHDPSARQDGSDVSLNPRVRLPNGFSAFWKRVSEAKKGLPAANLAEAGARLRRLGPACPTNPPDVWRVRSSGPAGASDGRFPPPVSRGKPFFASLMDKSSIGEMLREGRLRQRLSIAECAKRTHIAQRFIEALEEEQWDVLPSESHRQGFLRLYCRFLGVPSEDVLVLYRHGKPTSPTPQKEPLAHPVHPLAPERSWGISSWQQLVALIILVLVLAWAVYHAFWRSLAGSNVPPYSWARLRPHHPRLTGRGHEAPVQRIRIVSRNSSWLRVEEGGRLIYEGLLPGGLTKDWSGAEPFVIKVGDIQAVSVFWNDQPVDLAMGARGNVNELKLPPPK